MLNTLKHKGLLCVIITGFIRGCLLARTSLDENPAPDPYTSYFKVIHFTNINRDDVRRQESGRPLRKCPSQVAADCFEVGHVLPVCDVYLVLHPLRRHYLQWC